MGLEPQSYQRLFDRIKHHQRSEPWSPLAPPKAGKPQKSEVRSRKDVEIVESVRVGSRKHPGGIRYAATSWIPRGRRKDENMKKGPKKCRNLRGHKNRKMGVKAERKVQGEAKTKTGH